MLVAIGRTCCLSVSVSCDLVLGAFITASQYTQLTDNIARFDFRTHYQA
ncbi:hypothetical protein O9993_02910 [Vibrio lentus]|nr:hypothetical protein [Vibrio lentus]